MKKRDILLNLIIPLLLIFVVGFASASISILDVNDNYNFGDKLSIAVTLSPNSVEENFEINLVCENQTLNLYIVPAEASFSVGKEQKVNTYIILNKDNIGSMSGTCIVIASLSNENTATKTFEITDRLDVKVSLDKTSYNPEETINLKVEATKADGRVVDGFLEISGPIIDSKAVEKGNVNYGFSMAKNSEARDYTLSVSVYERGKDMERINEGVATISFSINQIPSSIITTFLTEDVSPEENFSFSSILYDQASDYMNESLTILARPEDKNAKDKLELTMNSGDNKIWTIPSNATAGKWILTSSYNLVSSSRELTIAAVSKIEFEFIDLILAIRNTGNAPYNGTVSVKIGDRIEKVDLILGIGEEKRYNINAPFGDYLVEVSNGQDLIARTLPLTGNAISITEVKSSLYNNRYVFVRVFLVLLVTACIIVIYMNLKRRQFNLMKFMPRMPPKRKYEQFHTSRGEKLAYLESTGATSRKAVNTPIISGEKMHSSLISLNLKNLSALPESAHTELNSILENVKGKKGMIDQKNGDITIIFSPLVTKTHENESLALKTAFDIFKKLDSYNKKAQKKIEFTLGVNSGEIIANLTNGILQYTGAKTLLNTKRVSELDRNKLLISENIRNKAGRELKVVRVGDVSGLKAYVVSDLAEKVDHSDRIAHIVKRMNE